MNKKVQGLKDDKDKHEWDLVPLDIVQEVIPVYKFGLKYSKDNWRKGFQYSRIYNSLMRHLLAFWHGENCDCESKKPHLAHALWNIITLIYLTKYYQNMDDRPKQSEKKEKRKMYDDTGKYLLISLVMFMLVLIIIMFELKLF